MIEFIESHYLLILACISLIAEVIIIIRSFRKNKVDQAAIIENLIDSVLPGFINLAESTCADGTSKLCLVVKLCIEKIAKYISKSDESYYRTLIIEKVESILSTPQKKEI